MIEDYLINNYYFSLDIDKEISLMENAIDTHNLEKLFEMHQITHNLDYWLINYPVATFKAAPADWHGLYVYFGVIDSYNCVE